MKGRKKSGNYTVSYNDDPVEYGRQLRQRLYKNESSHIPLMICENCKFSTRQKHHWRAYQQTLKHKVNSGFVIFLD